MHTPSAPTAPAAPAAPSTSDIRTRLGVGAGPARSFWRRRWVWLAAILAIAAILLWMLVRSRRNEGQVRYQTETAKQGALTVTVSATGQLESLTQVTVGTEISGVIEEVTVDFNSAVRVGQVLARINTDRLQAQSDEARAGLQAAKARQLQSKATVGEARTQLARLQSVRTLSNGRVPSKTEYDAQEAALKRAEADDANNAAGVAQAEASLRAIATDLRRANITSPINGIVLDRAVDPGQTVAASFQTPTLFTLAEDLTRMKLQVDVDEADVGRVQVGQAATFRVDAYPDRTFASEVTEVRSTATTSNGVVTYTTILTVDNAERLLKPGMTATAAIVVSHVDGAVLVPNAALRFTPPEQTATTTTSRNPLLPGGPPAQRTGVPAQASTGPQHIWVLKEGSRAPVSIEVTTGATDGTSTVITSGNVAPGTAVVVDVVTAK